MYRPHDAKVKNLKAKDYLGKARLVAASDKNNTFTGFTGSELKRTLIREDTSKDDRPLDNISFAATNLVKPGLSSRTRQQSEPPINRNVFPPTPPPESDKPAAQLADKNSPQGNIVVGMTGRAASVRSGAGRPAKLDLAKAGLEKEVRERPRLGTIRTASEPRGPSRSYSWSKHVDTEQPRRSYTNKQTPLRRHVTSDGEEADDEYPGELYDMYRRRRSSNGTRRAGSKSRRPKYIEEEESDPASDIDEGLSLDEENFEIVSKTKAPLRKPSRTASRRPEIRKVLLEDS